MIRGTRFARSARPLLAAITCFAAFPLSTSLGGTTELRVYDEGQRPHDSRLLAPKDLNGYFPFDVPQSRSTLR